MTNYKLLNIYYTYPLFINKKLDIIYNIIYMSYICHIYEL